ncbi:M28 family metallopeptidase [Parvularcula sp. IMCC14364]|uniref:M28 family metallopeptidase n=1 Tax=Parvularcula sp. IMCC14364 TaxID=3067902 RepID=UPI002740F25A|nr:M28 family metallopeptidase [Parvularcula sp. IMCC14364]
MKFVHLLMLGIAGAALTACGGEKSTPEAMAENEDVTVEVTTEAVAEPSTAIPDLPALPDISEAQFRDYLQTLASDDFEGRAPATAGGRKTVDWLEARMQEMGLKPANGDSYRQDVPLVEITLIPQQSSFAITTADGASSVLPYRQESVYWTKRVVEDVSFEDSELVFVGYGVVAPEYDWNDYEGVDVSGKTVVMLVNDPGYATQNPDLFNGNSMTYYGRWTYKYEEAARQGAAAAIVVHQTAPAAYGWGVVEGSWSGPQLDLERPDGGENRVALEGWIQESVAERLFAEAGLDFAQAQQDALSPDFTPVPMTGLTASGKIKNNINRNSSQNVAGYIEGASAPDEYILYMAHWDHLGRTFAAVGGGSGDGDTISNGAVDNATGTSGILNIAQSFADADMQPERSILFVAVTAEESGLLGSAYYAEDPLVPFSKTVGGINIDAMLSGGVSKDITVIGYGASELEDLLKAATDKRGMYLRPDPEPEKGYFYRSDHVSLAKKGVPMLYSKNGIDLVVGGEAAGTAISENYRANLYHKPADEYSEDWEVGGIMTTLEILRDVGGYMAYSDIQPNWYDGNEFRALRDSQMGN